jgi:hypothetical protein
MIFLSYISSQLGKCNGYSNTISLSKIIYHYHRAFNIVTILLCLEMQNDCFERKLKYVFSLSCQTGDESHTL